MSETEKTGAVDRAAVNTTRTAAQKSFIAYIQEFVTHGTAQERAAAKDYLSWAGNSGGDTFKDPSQYKKEEGHYFEAVWSAPVNKFISAWNTFKAGGSVKGPKTIAADAAAKLKADAAVKAKLEAEAAAKAKAAAKARDDKQTAFLATVLRMAQDGSNNFAKVAAAYHKAAAGTVGAKFYTPSLYAADYYNNLSAQDRADMKALNDLYAKAMATAPLSKPGRR